MALSLPRAARTVASSSGVSSATMGSSPSISQLVVTRPGCSGTADDLLRRGSSHCIFSYKAYIETGWPFVGFYSKVVPKEKDFEKLLDLAPQPDLGIYGDFDYDLEDEDYGGRSNLSKCQG